MADIKGFVEAPSLEKLETLKKAELIEVCKLLEVEEGVLPLDSGTSTGEEVIAQGIEGGFVNVPLHRIYLKSKLISGPVVVGTRPTLPMKGVALLLGNDLAGGRVIANPKVTSKLVNRKC